MEVSENLSCAVECETPVCVRAVEGVRCLSIAKVKFEIERSPNGFA